MVLFYCHGCLLSNCETRPGDNLTPVVIEDEKFKKIFEKIAGFSIESQEDKRDCLMCNKCMKKLMDCLEFFDRIERHEKDFFPIIRKQNAKLEDNVKVQEDRTDFQAESELESEVEEGKYEIIEDDPFKINEILTFAVPVLLYLVVLAVLNIENNKTERGGEEFKQLFELKEDFDVPDETVGSGFSADNSVSDSETAKKLNLAPLRELQVRIEKLNTIPDINESDKDKGSNNDENQNKKLKEDSVRDKIRVKCNICGSFFAKKYFKTHIEAVHDKIKIKCEICGSMLSKHYMSIHIKSTHDKIRHECQICGLKLIRKDTLKNHLEAVHQKVRKFECDRCGLKFYRRSMLRKHINRHINNPNYKLKLADTSNSNRPFKCNFKGCEKFFKCKNSLKTHQEVHKDDRPFTCSVCKRTFKRRDDCKKHQAKCSTKKSFF